MTENYHKTLGKRSILYVLLTAAFMVQLSFNNHLVSVISDGAFHFSRIVGLNNIWSTPINFEIFGYNGQAANVFYPWLTIYPMYLAYQLTHNLIMAFYIYFGGLTLLTFFLTDYCVYKITQNQKVSILASIIYGFSLCRTGDIFYRLAFGEAIGMTILPIVLLGIYNIFYTEKKNWYPLAIGMTLLAYTHMLSLLMAAMLVAAFMVIALLHRSLNKSTLWSLTKATSWSVLLSLGQLIPMIEFQHSTKITSPTTYNLADTAISSQQLLTQAIDNTISGVNSIGIIILLALIIALIQLKQLPKFVKDSTILALIFTIFSTKWLPWKWLTFMLEPIQFPWRLLVLATILATIGGAYALTQKLPEAQYKSGLFISIIVIILFHWGTMNQLQMNIHCQNTRTLSAQQWNKLVHAKEYTDVGSQDYVPLKAENEKVSSMLSKEQVFINGKVETPKKVVIKDSYKTFTLNTTDNQTIVFPVYAYTGYHVTCDGKEIKAKASKNDLISVKSQKGEHHYKIYYTRTPIAKASIMLSICSFVAFISCAGIRYQKLSHRKES